MCDQVCVQETGGLLLISRHEVAVTVEGDGHACVTHVPLYDHRGILKGTTRFNAGSAFAWIRWTREAWRLVKLGRIRGLSMGGSAHRIRLEAEPAVAKRAPPERLIDRVLSEGSVTLR